VTSTRDFLVRGLLAGLFAGLITFGVGYAVGEPSINAAIAIEESAGGHHHGEETAANEESAAAEVPRALQSTIGLLAGTTIAGVTLGGLVGVLSALALGRLGRLGVRGVSLAIASMGFVSVSLLPFLAYPPNPPAVGDAETIGTRTALYFILVAISIITAVTAVLVGWRLAARWDAWYAILTAVIGYLLVILTAIALLPSYSEVPVDFPAIILYQFRVASLVTQLALWAALGVIVGELLYRLQLRVDARLTEPEYVNQPNMP
jgi:predicted cobalt transporter CbtA